ncbi:hypothetical protein AVEN_140490-1 [Araneus ventricosus]|uniref:Uncharacterized protein n=1 Tax=Araneus ventricosus TaxID=182803 RepID=A0A4Y2NPN7_ARAVE|nr:hypothetical protein AVEN_140490-1 [Araneus ventricosus]
MVAGHLRRGVCDGPIRQREWRFGHLAIRLEWVTCEREIGGTVLHEHCVATDSPAAAVAGQFFPTKRKWRTPVHAYAT